FRLIGKDVMRVELPGKVDGSAQYSIDVQVPGMLYGAVLRAPVEGSGPENLDGAFEKAVAGQLAKLPGAFSAQLIALPYGVGVLGDTPWAVFAARDIVARTIKWSRAGKA